MLKILVPASGGFSETEIFLEHSLVSLSKWEALHETPFYGKADKTPEETKSYVKQMILTPNPPPDVLEKFSSEDYNRITQYINSKQSATYFSETESSKKGQPEAITSELIYYWMINFQIPFDPCERWHLNRLMTLVRIAGIKQSPPKKMTRQQIAEQQRRLNEERRTKLGTSG